MATLSSVPEVPSFKLDTKLGPGYQPRVSPFERSRPRSRVLIISRQSSRTRRNSKAAALSPSSNHDDLAQQGACPVSPSSQYRDMRSWTPQSNASTVRGNTNHDIVSDIPSSAQSSYSHEPTSIDLDSFPVPPTGNQAWQYPSRKDQDNAHKPSKRQMPHLGLANVKPPVQEKHNHQGKSRLVVSPLKPATARRPGTPVPNVQTNESASQLSSVLDPALLDAISKSVAEHLRLVPSVNSSVNRKASKRLSVDQQTIMSRTPSQAQALDTFTKELDRYADRVGAKGKLPIFTPTLAKSPPTLHTVSALLPFRNEFRAAGLAVTSKDQKRCKTRPLHDPTRSRRPHPHAVNGGQSRVSQMDGRVDSCSEPTTVVDFMDPSTADSWRRALVNEIPPKRHSIIPRRPRSPRACFPCLPGRLIRLATGKNSSLLDRPASQASQIARVPRDTVFISARGPSTPFKRSSKVKGVRPKGCSVQPAQDNLFMDKTTPARDRTGPSIGVPGLKAGKSSATVRMSPGTGLKEQVAKRNESLHESQATGPELDDDNATERPKVFIKPRSKAWGQNASNQQAHSLPTHPMKWPRPATVEDTFVSMPDLPTAQGRKAGKIPPLNALREFLTRSVTAKAMQEMNRHDLGRYPTQLSPNSRPRIWSTKPPDIPRRTSSKKRKQFLDSSATDDSQVEDRNVLQGLHIAAAAACDENINILVLEKTGVHIRHFLSDLMAFQSLELPQPGEDREQQAKRRKYQMRRLKRQVRKSRELIGHSANILWGGR